MNFNNKKILIVVAHPDDETLGMGGTINKLIQEFDAKIKVVILGEGLTSRDKNKPDNFRSDLIKHQKDIEIARGKLKYQELSTYNLPDNMFDTVPLIDIIKIIENEKKLFNPEIIFTHHFGDLNIDHQITYKSVITSSRPVQNEIIKTIITFETLSSTEWNLPNSFKPNFYIELNENNIKSKIEAMESYRFEKREFPHPRSPMSIKNKCIMNGVNVGVNYAEAFCIQRSII